jgi:hypothetical protein
MEKNIDGLVKSHLKRHPGEPRIKSRAGTGVQNNLKYWIPAFAGRREKGLSDFLRDYQYCGKNRQNPYGLIWGPFRGILDKNPFHLFPGF